MTTRRYERYARTWLDHRSDRELLIRTTGEIRESSNSSRIVRVLGTMDDLAYSRSVSREDVERLSHESY